MKISDIITQTIIQLLDESEDGRAEIQRNELAENMGCVPSQINYVLSSRFTPERGYQIESYRGGGGYIRITRVRMDKPTAMMHIVNSIGETMDATTARIVLDNCLNASLLSDSAATLICAALSNYVMAVVPPGERDRLRAAILKQMLLSQING